MTVQPPIKINNPLNSYLRSGSKSWSGHGSSHRSNLDLFDIVKKIFAIFTIFIFLASIYLTFNSFFIGLFIPPVACVAIAGAIIKFFDWRAHGKKFFWDTLALAGVFLALLAFISYQTLAPIIEMVSKIK